MAFKVVTSAYLWPVKFKRPVDGGTFEDVELTLRFKRFDAIKAAGLDLQETKLDFCRRLVVGFGNDVLGEDGKQLPFSAENLDLVLSEINLIDAIMESWGESMSGGKAKN